MEKTFPLIQDATNQTLKSSYKVLVKKNNNKNTTQIQFILLEKGSFVSHQLSQLKF